MTERDKAMRVSELKAEHIDMVAELEELCFAHPLSKTNLGMLLPGGIGNGFVMVDEEKGVAAAYGGIICVLDEGQITNLAVHPDARRRGVGIALMRALELLAKEKNLIFLSLEVRESNLAARSLYSSLGWEDRGVRKNFYSHPMENAVVMTRDLPQISR
jgi:ribosomal-protein-alanine N-acetyltransferase